MVKKYTQEFKDSIVEMAQSGKSLKAIHTEYGVWPEFVRSWLKKLIILVNIPQIISS